MVSIHLERLTESVLLLQKALNQTRWKEYFSGGRKYYYNVRFSLI